MNPTIKKVSKCIYIVNGQRVDIRRRVRYDGSKLFTKFQGERQALFVYLAGRKPRSYGALIRLDQCCCEIINRRMPIY